MAKVELRPEFASISGKVGNMIFRTFKNGQVHMYKAPEYKRKKPVSEAEMQARGLFCERLKRVHELMAQGVTKQEAWARAKQEII